jgi:hypothetical protein
MIASSITAFPFPAAPLPIDYIRESPPARKPSKRALVKIFASSAIECRRAHSLRQPSNFQSSRSRQPFTGRFRLPLDLHRGGAVYSGPCRAGTRIPLMRKSSIAKGPAKYKARSIGDSVRLPNRQLPSQGAVLHAGLPTTWFMS